jgi:hypothetical protein
VWGPPSVSAPRHPPCLRRGSPDSVIGLLSRTGGGSKPVLIAVRGCRMVKGREQWEQWEQWHAHCSRCPCSLCTEADTRDSRSPGCTPPAYRVWSQTLLAVPHLCGLPARPPIVKVLACSRRPRRSARHPVGTKLGYPSRDIMCNPWVAPVPKLTRRCGSGTTGWLPVDGCSAHSKGPNFVPPHPYPAKLGIPGPHDLPLHITSIGPKPARRRPAATCKPPPWAGGRFATGPGPTRRSQLPVVPLVRSPGTM